MESKAVKVQGIECPIIREGDNIVDIVVSSILKETECVNVYWNDDGEPVEYSTGIYQINDKDIIGITESVVARAAGQYITVDDIAADIEKKFGKDATICLVHPIYSRNRFAMILKGIARASARINLFLPTCDEVGNPRGTNPFTGVNIEEYYKELCKSENCECKVYGDYWQTSFVDINTDNCIFCNLHNYTSIYTQLDSDEQFKRCTLADICSDKSPDWGLLGTNKATEERLKLFPSKAECQRVCEEVKAKIKEEIGVEVICCIYGDGAFKDPVGGIWEFADPTTMPGYTDAELIESTPNEIKLKAMIDDFDRDNDDLVMLAVKKNREKSIRTDNKGDMGTTPRLYRDLLASLMDLTSGSGDRATPVVLIQNYF